MKKRPPYTEPYTPAEAAELATAMEATQAAMRANTERLMDERLVRAWTDPAEEAAPGQLPDRTENLK